MNGVAKSCVGRPGMAMLDPECPLGHWRCFKKGNSGKKLCGGEGWLNEKLIVKTGKICYN
jgi:hypothetical protein